MLLSIFSGLKKKRIFIMNIFSLTGCNVTKWKASVEETRFVIDYLLTSKSKLKWVCFIMFNFHLNDAFNMFQAVLNYKSKSVVRSHPVSGLGLSCRCRVCVGCSQWLLWWYGAPDWTDRLCPQRSDGPSSAGSSQVLSFSEQNETQSPFTETGRKYSK